MISLVNAKVLYLKMLNCNYQWFCVLCLLIRCLSILIKDNYHAVVSHVSECFANIKDKVQGWLHTFSLFSSPGIALAQTGSDNWEGFPTPCALTARTLNT